MKEFFKQVGIAAESGLYFVALAGALIIPDICGALDSPDGQTTGTAYSKWFDTHAAQRFYGRLDGATCYRFRCSFLHQGTTQHPSSAYSRVMFIEPGATTNVIHMGVMDDALVIDVRLFCLDMVSAAEEWEQAAVGTEPYETNIKQRLRRYPDGLPPYIGGVPVIS